MALANGAYFTCTATATTGNINGGGFNPNNANMLTNLVCDSGTGNTASPVVSSASYNFVAGDVGHWVYIQSNTGGWTSGWYQIASVASNKATLKAAIGAAQQVVLGFKALNTVVGCATTGTPTGGTFTIDYSQTDTAIISGRTDFAAVGASTTLTSATGGFTPVMVGNTFHQTTTGTGAFGVVGWYEIVSYTNATTVVLDRTPNSGTASVACTGYIGGAARLNALEDAFLESFSPGSKLYVKAGAYTLSASVNISTGIGTSTEPIIYLAYTTIPGDFVQGATRPVFTQTSSNSFTVSAYIYIFDLEIIGGGTNVIVTLATNYVARCKFINTSTTAGRNAMTGLGWFYECEAVSQFGYAFSHTGSSALVKVRRCYFHDSLRGMSLNSTASVITDNVIANCTEAAIVNITNSSASSYTITGNTFYGRSVTPVGIGLSLPTAGAGNILLDGNIFSGCTTGISVGTQANSIMGTNNNFYNNTTDVTNYLKSQTDTALDPQFTDITEIAISNGTITGGTAVLTSSGADFSSVEDNVDYFTWVSHTGGVGTFIGQYLITSHTTTTLTFNINAGTSGSVTGVTGYIQTGHNFTIGANMKNKWNVVQPTYTSYIAAGGVQPQVTGSTSTTVGWASQS